MHNLLLPYILHIADNCLIHGHRLSEWCGHGPALETDIALSNIALDNIGAARSLYACAADIEGNGKTEDSYPYFRDVREFKNILLTELPNGNFADTIAKCFYFDAFQFHFYTALQHSTHAQLAAIAAKSIKEVTYHLRFSSEWVIRLGDGTAASKQKMQTAIYEHWEYTGEMFLATEVDLAMHSAGIGPDLALIKEKWLQTITQTIEEATLAFPLSNEKSWFQSGGKTGIHSEHLGFILTDLQYMQKTYPGCEW